MPKRDITCQDCYFRQNGLCALVVERPCPTFRLAAHALTPSQQPSLVPRPLAPAATAAY